MAARVSDQPTHHGWKPAPRPVSQTTIDGNRRVGQEGSRTKIESSAWAGEDSERREKDGHTWREMRHPKIKPNSIHAPRDFHKPCLALTSTYAKTFHSNYLDTCVILGLVLRSGLQILDTAAR